MDRYIGCSDGAGSYYSVYKTPYIDISRTMGQFKAKLEIIVGGWSYFIVYFGTPELIDILDKGVQIPELINKILKLTIDQEVLIYLLDQMRTNARNTGRQELQTSLRQLLNI